jgi:quercetin dioxygenase-like cupin family protein
MTMRTLRITAAFVCILLANAQTPAISIKNLMQAPLGETSEARMSLLILNVAPGVTVPTHSHTGAVFAYVLDGDIENQIEPEPPQTFHAEGFFHERPMQIHRLLRNSSGTQPAKLLIFQNAGTQAGRKPLLQESLANLTNQEITVASLVAPPGSAAASVHQHLGPVFAYIVSGEIENQVDPDPPKIYRAGDVFYEPPMHAHRLFRNVSQTAPAKLILFQISEKGQPLATGAN